MTDQQINGLLIFGAVVLNGAAWTLAMVLDAIGSKRTKPMAWLGIGGASALTAGVWSARCGGSPAEVVAWAIGAALFMWLGLYGAERDVRMYAARFDRSRHRRPTDFSGL